MTEQLFTRRAPARTSSWNSETWTVDVVVSAGADVRSYDAKGPIIERINPADQRDRLPTAPLPLLLGHQHSDQSIGLGQVENVRLDAGKIIGTARLSKNHPTAKLLAANLDEGIGFFVSMGYHRQPAKEYSEGSQRVIEFLIDLKEVSVVAVAADANAKTRGQDMSTPNPATTPNSEATPVDRAAINTAIRSIGELANLDQAWIDQQVDANATVEQARAAAFEAMQQRSQQTRTISSTAHNSATLDDPEVRARAMGEAIFARINPAHQVSGAARTFVGLSIPELARESLRSAGVTVTGMSASTIVTRALNSTSDFAISLGDAVGRTMRQAYSEAPSGLKAVARMTTMRDFRERKRIQTSQFDRLEKVNEAGEFKRGSFKEEAEAYKLATFGKVFGITRQALVNDDVGVFNDVPRKLGIAAAAFEAQALVDLLISGSGAGPLMSDNKRLFHADHSNLAASAGAPDETRLSAARLAMRKQTDASGQLISVAPKFIVIPSDLETATEKLLSTVQAAETANVNAFAGKLTPVVEPRFTSASAWYLVDNAIDGLEYAHLEGEPGPQIETRAGFDVDGVETRIRLDFGCGFIDWRGWYRNAG
jgi:hypothetical protein